MIWKPRAKYSGRWVSQKDTLTPVMLRITSLMLNIDSSSSRCRPITLTDCGVSWRLIGSRVVVDGSARAPVTCTLSSVLGVRRRACSSASVSPSAAWASGAHRPSPSSRAAASGERVGAADARKTAADMGFLEGAGRHAARREGERTAGKTLGGLPR